MITRFLWILAGLVVIGTVAVFLLYVSALALVTAMVVLIGLLAALVLGYWAGSNTQIQPPPRAKRLRNAAVIDAPRDVLYFPELAGTNRQRVISIDRAR